MTARNAFYAQSGGVTAVINASACGVIETARKYPDKIKNVLAGRNGIVGALTEELIDTGKESREDIAALRYTPGGAFGSCRYKLADPEKTGKNSSVCWTCSGRMILVTFFITVEAIQRIPVTRFPVFPP